MVLHTNDDCDKGGVRNRGDGCIHDDGGGCCQDGDSADGVDHCTGSIRGDQFSTLPTSMPRREIAYTNFSFGATSYHGLDRHQSRRRYIIGRNVDYVWTLRFAACIDNELRS